MAEDLGPVAARAEQHGGRAVREDRVRHRGLGLVVQIVGGRAQLHRHGERAPLREGAEVVPRLLEGDHRARAAGVPHVDALHVCPETQRSDQVRVQARDESSRAGRRHEKVDVRRVQPGPSETGLDGLDAQAHAALGEAGRQLVDGLAPGFGGGDVEVSTVDGAVVKEAALEPVAIPEEVGELFLGEAPGRHCRAGGDDAGRLHVWPSWSAASRSSGLRDTPLHYATCRGGRGFPARARRGGALPSGECRRASGDGRR